MTDEEKLKFYKETLESIVMSGHSLQSPNQAGDMLTYVIEIARGSLEKAGDIEV